VPSEVGHDDPQTGIGEHRDDVDVAVDVVGIAVQQHHNLAVARTGLEVGDLEPLRADVVQWPEMPQAAHAARSRIQARSSSGSSGALSAMGNN
jgi:hypothetical protein